jgi:PAS domain S-box-containing protein
MIAKPHVLNRESMMSKCPFLVIYGCGGVNCRYLNDDCFCGDIETSPGNEDAWCSDKIVNSLSMGRGDRFFGLIGDEDEIRYEVIDFVAKHSNDIFWVLDENLNCLYVSDGVMKVTGYYPTVYKSLTLEEKFTPPSVKTITDEYVTSYKDALHEVGCDKFKLNTILKSTLRLDKYKKTGETVPVETHLQVRIVNGKPVLFAGVTKDISGRLEL